MDKIPESLIPITKHEDGQYFSGKTPIPKHWTIYRVEQNRIFNDGNLDYSKTGNSDIKMYRDDIYHQKPYEWYVAKDNKPFKTPYDIPRSPSPRYRSPSPRYRSPSPRSVSRESQEKIKEKAAKRIQNMLKKNLESILNKRSGGKKSRTRRGSRRGTRRRNRRGTSRK